LDQLGLAWIQFDELGLTLMDLKLTWIGNGSTQKPLVGCRLLSAGDLAEVHPVK